jgi:hypothetical protein
MRSTFWGMVTGLALFFPGTVLLQWMITKLGLYQAQTVSLTDSCLVIIMVLLTMVIFQQRSLLRAQGREEEAERRELRHAAGHRASSYDGERRSRRSSRRDL